MDNKKGNKGKKEIRLTRYFSEEVKREVVKKIERNEISVSLACREYEVSSASIYNWMYRYSLHLKKGNRLIVEKDSQSESRLNGKELRKYVANLERIVGQKQMEIDILSKVVEFGSEEIGFDLKKKYNGKLSNGTGTINDNTTTN